MKFKLFIPLILGFLVCISTAPAQLSPADTERLCQKLKFNSVKCFSDALAQLKVQPSASESLTNYLADKTLQAQVSDELAKLMPEVEKSLKANPEVCALVSATVDFSTNGNVTQYNLRALQLEGTGDTAVQAVAPSILSNVKLGTTDKTPAEGFNYDTNLSHALCFGIDQGELKVIPIFQPALHTNVVAAVAEIQKAENLRPRPAAPKNLRIQTSP